MTTTQAKQILIEMDRLNLEAIGAMNLLDEQGLISNQVILLQDIANEDAEKCVEFLKKLFTEII